MCTYIDLYQNLFYFLKIVQNTNFSKYITNFGSDKCNYKFRNLFYNVYIRIYKVSKNSFVIYIIYICI